MQTSERLRQAYARVLRTPVLGPVAAVPVRLVKRVVDDPTVRFRGKLDLAVAASAGLRNDLDAALRRVEALEKELQHMRLVVKQQTALLDAAFATAPNEIAKGRTPVRVVVRVERDGEPAQEYSVPVDPESRAPASASRSANDAA